MTASLTSPQHWSPRQPWVSWSLPTIRTSWVTWRSPWSSTVCARQSRGCPAFSDVLRLRFGFDGDSPASLQSTAERLGVGVRRVRRAEEEALAALSFDADVLGVHQAA